MLLIIYRKCLTSAALASNGAIGIFILGALLIIGLSSMNSLTAATETPSKKGSVRKAPSTTTVPIAMDLQDAGPSSASEREVLWQSGLEAMSASHWETAAKSFGRIIKRYPGSDQFLKAHEYYGRSQIKLDHSELALKPLKYFAEASQKNSDKVIGKTLLAQAFSTLLKYQEALLVILEAEKLFRSPSHSPQQLKEPPSYRVLLHVLIQKTIALIGLEKDTDAQTASDGAAQVASEHLSDLNLEDLSAVYLNQLTLKLWQCARFPVKLKSRQVQAVSEEVAKDQHYRRGLCILETVPSIKKILNSGVLEAINAGSKKLLLHLNDYEEASRSPPPPLALKPKDRTAQQRKRYFAELSLVLRKESKLKLTELIELLKSQNESQKDTQMDHLVQEIRVIRDKIH